MAKMHVSSVTILISSSILVFIGIIVSVFFLTAKLGQKSKVGNPQLEEASRENSDNYQQVRRIRFTDQSNGEYTDIFMDGTVNQYDKNGKLKKRGRRGFAETQNIFKNFEWMINNGETLNGGKYQIDIETQKGIIVVDPGGPGGGAIDDVEDFIDDTLNPTPPPTSGPTPHPSSTPAPSPTPEPSATPGYLDAPPFKCSDYYTSGKPVQISNIICGPSGN